MNQVQKEMFQEQKLEYTFNIQFVVEPTYFEISRNCNGVSFVNVGTTLATIENFPINASLVPGANGESFNIGGNRGEILGKIQINIGFPVANGRVAVIQKLYNIPERG